LETRTQKNTEEKPNNTLNKTLKDIEQNIKRTQENKKQLLNLKTSSITDLEEDSRDLKKKKKKKGREDRRR
jgi:hypothetical protein